MWLRLLLRDVLVWELEELEDLELDEWELEELDELLDVLFFRRDVDFFVLTFATNVPPSADAVSVTVESIGTA